MDPKMDSGIVRRYYSEAIDSGVAAAAPVPLSSDRTIDVQCVIDIMDHLLACEVHSLFQIRIHIPLFLVIGATYNSVVSVVSDEEDLFTMTYGLSLKGDGDEKCLSMLYAVEETISRQLRAHKAPPSKRRVVEGSHYHHHLTSILMSEAQNIWHLDTFVGLTV
ncbi:hypothetical protein RHGRI_005767 [Rhododendron griersonianum]|uniref:Uncharacterized protein n=1 Tax=Rhododendron griersonianum TaxID=479676 RepID=A0AAV6LGD0_9ERIC|nr:hypothetical protein RHGRI_005767 [Rhododendron griersonianum]